jgi:hypothetical protein
MPRTKYSKYIITDLKPKVEAPWIPVFKPQEITTVLFLDSKVIKGAFYVETAWFWPPLAENGTRGQPHQHDYNEVLAFFGSNPKNPNDLGGLLEFQMNGENHIISKSCLIFVPKGVQHGPPIFSKITFPIFHFACGTGKEYF